MGKVLPMEFSSNQEHIHSENSKSKVNERSSSDWVSKGSVLNGPLPIIEMPPSKNQENVEDIDESGGSSNASQVISPTPIRLPNEFRSIDFSPEISSNASHQNDSVPGSEVCNPELNSSLQKDLCKDVSKKLKVKSNRGWPKKASNGVRNPFEIGIKFKDRKRKSGGCKKTARMRRSREAPNCLQIVSTNLVGNSTREALEIIRSAEMMGLEIKGDRDLAVQEISRQLEAGEL